MRPYETLVVLTNDVVIEQMALMEGFTTVITAGGGTLDENHDWGSRKLAYPIKKQDEGHYYLLEYNAEPAVVSELERTMRISDGVLRYMSIQQDHTGLPKPREYESERGERGDVPLHEMRGGPGGYRPRDSEYRGRRPDEDRRSGGGPAAAPTPDAPKPPGEPAAASTSASEGASDEGVKTDE
ncbi:MAG: 30S ribosomal protein S6 [Myxococcales bacterium]|nr:MAG: 30S ribosomal protein S6 [Myxococcales bacterium]